MSDLWALLPAGGLLFLPGYALSLLVSRGQMEPFQRGMVAVGLSVALVPLILLLATAAGLSLGGLAAWGLVALAGGVCLWWWYRNPPGRPSGLADWVRRNPQYPLLLVVLAASLGVRLYAVRDLSIPMWGDSYNHAWLARLIAERGQVPDSFYPYFPLDSLTYHFGFHSLVAFFHWMTGLSILKSIIILGQVLNALSAATVYLLAHRLTRSHTAALVSALVVGLVSSMPAYYVNWGRYTQLAGQVLLPVAIFLAVEAMEARRRAYMALAALAAAGLFLVHYRVIVFYAAFLLAYLAHGGLRHRDLGKLVLQVRLLAGVGAGALALAYPWLGNLARSLPRVQASVPQLDPQAWSQWMAGYNALGEVTFFVSPPLMALSLAALAWGLWRREGAIILVGAWTALLFLAANSNLVGLEPSGFLNNFAVLIALYLPVSILVGWLAGQVFPVLPRAGAWAPYAVAGLAALAGAWGGWESARIIDPQYVLATKADERALAWVRENTPPQAKFLINSFFAYGGRLVVGSDGGWWLPYLAGRQNTVPPIIYGAESSPGRDYAGRVNAFARSVQGPVPGPDALPLLREEGVTHIFVGEKGGALDPARLARDPNYQAIYRDGGVWVFKIRYPGEGS